MKGPSDQSDDSLASSPNCVCHNGSFTPYVSRAGHPSGTTRREAARSVPWIDAASEHRAAPTARQRQSNTRHIAHDREAEYRYADGRYDRRSALAGDLVSRRVSATVATAGTPTIRAAKGATSTISIQIERLRSVEPT